MKTDPEVTEEAPSVPHDTHHDEDVEDAGEEVCMREMVKAEVAALQEAAKEFKHEATLASLQDCGQSPITMWEVCCRPTSTLTAECQNSGMVGLRKSIENGYDLEKRSTAEKLKEELKRERPRRLWFSLRCTEWTLIQNINQRTEAQRELLRKRRQKARRMAKHGLEVIEEGVKEDPQTKFYWEWPKNAYAGWRSPEMLHFLRTMTELGVRIYWTEIHGCMHGLKSPEGEYLNKPWYVMTNDANFHHHCRLLCDHSHEHREGGIVGIGSKAVASTAYYPKSMVKNIVKVWKGEDEQWRRKRQSPHLAAELFQMEAFVTENEMNTEAPPRQEEGVEDISKEKRDRSIALLHKLHRAAGHPTNQALARLCKERGMPKWMVTLALNLQCQACVDNQRGEQKILPYSLGAKPAPWQVVALDVTEMVFPHHNFKVRFLVMVDMVMKFASMKLIWKGSISDAGTDSGRTLVNAFVEGWLLHRPRPQWVLVDPQTSLSAGDFVNFMELTGIGVSVTPGEAHWQAGTVESIIRVLKNVMKKMRNQHPEIDPEICAGLAVNSHNTQSKVKGFSPVQWAYGTNANWDEGHMGPIEYNAQSQHVPYKFWMTHRLRSQAEDVWRKAQATEAWTRLKNASSRPSRTFHVGQWVCVWRTAIWRTRKKNINPEPRYVGPGRICLIEPAILAENQSAVYWVLLGTRVWRCAPEQLRLATPQEITLEELGDKALTVPVMEQLRRTTKVTDVTKEPGYPLGGDRLPGVPPTADEAMEEIPEREGRAQLPQEWHDDMRRMQDRMERHKRRRDEERDRRSVSMETWRWKQLISVNENRRREGLPPIMELPPIPHSSEDDLAVFADGTVFHQLDGDNDAPITEECYQVVVEKIKELEETLRATEERNRLREQIAQEKRNEQILFNHFAEACDRGDEVCEMVLELDDWKEFLNGGHVYTKQMMASTKEINWKTLQPHHKPLVLESMARELAEVLQSQALKAVTEKVPAEELQRRSIPMRWLLTWKPLDEYSDPSKEPQPGIIRDDGMAKAKARIVLIGYKHPDLAKRDPRTGKSLLQTSSPTLSRMGRNLMLQSGAIDRHTLECADAKSAFLQAEHHIGSTRLYTTAVDEISNALHVPYGTAVEIVGAIYGLTNAPRVFWLDADQRLQKEGGEPHGIDRCLWVFRNRHGRVCGRVGAHVDDFIIMGDHSDPDWIRIRDRIKQMYRWSPWKRGNFIFAGVQLTQLQNFDILLSQEHFCEELRPVEIANERQRPKDDTLSAKELSQARGLVMKAQWRAIQTAPQYCARIGLASSALAKANLEVLKEANAIVKELKKTSKDGLIFHSFSDENLSWHQVIFLHFCDAAKGNRVDGTDTGGYVTAVASPRILDGKEARMSIVDYKSWKLDRPSKGSNGAETQALYEGEDKAWKSRLFWSLLHGHRLSRTNADHLSSLVESLLITDSRGCYDALSNSDSSLLGMNSAKSGVELMSVQRGLRDGSNSYATWVPSDMNLADVLTKVSYESFKTYALWNARKSWIVKFNSEFVSARKQQKLRQQQGKPKHALMDPTPQEDEFDLSCDWPSRDLPAPSVSPSIP